MADPAQKRLAITSLNNYGLTLEEAARQLNITQEEFLERLKDLNIQNRNLPRAAIASLYYAGFISSLRRLVRSRMLVVAEGRGIYLRSQLCSCND
ncbi:hypothetical protein Tco_0464812 [Tanacetum coccineum]